MKIKDLILEMIVVGIIAFIVVFVVIYLWNLIFHGAGVVALGYSAKLALILGLVIPLSRAFEKGKK